MKKLKKNRSLYQDGQEGVFEVFQTTPGGELLARLKGRKEPLLVLENKRIKPPLGEGDEFVGKLSNYGDLWWVRPTARVKTALTESEKIYGIIEKRDGKIYLKPAEKNARMDYLLEKCGKVKNGDFVSVELSGERKFKQARVIKNFGPFDLNKATASLVLEKYEIPYEFSAQAMQELNRLPKFDFNSRLDLTGVDLVTIDGDDSKDFDDAVWAQKTPLGFNLIVAIADVAFYVRPGSALDREAYSRGNSVYLPNMVVPMLPEKLSNNLCSLMPQKPRAAIACLMTIDKAGKLLTFEFKRAVIKSAARLTYRQVQDAIDGHLPQLDKFVAPLYEAYLALAKARKGRGALELSTVEIKIKVDKDGQIKSIAPEENLVSNQLIEEFMVAANNAAALTLEKSKQPIMFRVHDLPPEEKLADMKGLLESFKMRLPDRPALKPEHFNKLIAKCEKEGEQQGISELVLRMQSQAQYSPKNIGHFGLGLKDYVHFTSPIRRYADLLIHRALIAALGLPEGGGLEKNAVGKFEEIAKHINETERRAVNAERDLVARCVSAYLQPALGQMFEVSVSGVSSAGVFVRVNSLGAEGLIPLSSLPDDDYVLENGNTSLVGEFGGRTFDFGDVIKAKLLEASPITGGLIFKYIDPEEGENYYVKGGRGRIKIAEKKAGRKGRVCTRRHSRR